MRFLKADKLFDGNSYLPDGMVLVVNSENILKGIVSENTTDKNNIEHFKGVITPGFVNAHCHLELSHLKNKIALHTSLPEFGKQVVSLRHITSKKEISERMKEADLEMWSNGIVAVGDISNTEDSFKQKLESKIQYHTFIELIGLNPIHSQSILENGKTLFKKLREMNLSGSLSPHAPYSTSRELIKLIADFDTKNNLPLSIHNQESAEENKFFEGKESEFHGLYNFLSLDISWFQAPGKTSLNYYLDALPQSNSILVHNTFTTLEEVILSEPKDIYWCFCPVANKYIENKLPDFSIFSRQKSKICIGTDSLASNTMLNLIQEANLILENSRAFSPDDILRALTYNGAKALHISDKFGGFIKGKNAGLNLIEFENSKINFIKKIC